MKRNKYLMFSGLSIFLSLIFLISISEIILYFLGWDQPFYIFHPQIGYVIKPSSTIKIPTGLEGGSRWIFSNSKGLRDIEHYYEKKEGVKRILILGDSFCEALQVDLKDTFFRILQTKLDSARHGNTIEIINGGVSGYGTDRELLFYQYEGRKYHPDYVILAFVFNDVRNNFRNMQVQMYGDRNEPYFNLRDGELKLENFPAHQSSIQQFKQFLRNHFRTYNLLWRLIKGAELTERAVDPEKNIPYDYFIYSKMYDNDWREAWQITSALIGKLKQEVNLDGAELIIIAVTNDFQIHKDHLSQMEVEYPKLKEMDLNWEKPNQLLNGICKQQNIQFVDLLDDFRIFASNHPGIFLHTFGGHWTAAGHKETAEVLFKYFLGKDDLLSGNN